MRRVAALEARCKGRLLDRNREGATPTLLGQQVLDIARDMQAPVTDLERLIAGQRGERSWVSITVTQGLGINWLIPNAAALQADHPLIGIDFRISNTVADILRFDSDLAIQMTPPTAADVVAIKLGRMHFELFASERYLALHGRPNSIEALRNHRFIEQWDGHVSNGHLANLLGQVRAIQIVAKSRALPAQSPRSRPGSASALFRTTASPSAIKSSRYSSPPPPIVTSGSPTVENPASPSIAATIDWLKKIFDCRKWPWFDDEFMSAATLPPLFE